MPRGPDRKHKNINILAFAYVFPPDAGSGTYRTLYFANHWARQGDDVTIVTVKEQCFLATALIDRGLCKEVHPSICIVRASAKRPLQKLLAIKSAFRQKTSTAMGVETGIKNSQSENPARTHGVFRKFKDAITDLLSCPDVHIGWVPDAVRRGYHIAKTTRVDCIYATGGPWSCLFAATLLHKLCRIPLVLDFRDPWVSNPNMIVKSRFSRYVQKKMESMCVNASRIVVANTEELRQDFIMRYSNLDPRRFVTITNGFEDMPRETSCSTEKFILVHAGALYQSRNPLNFLRAVVELVNDGAIPAERFKVQLVGGASIADSTVESDLRSEALRDVLEIIPRVSHDKALLFQQRASALILIQTGFPLQVPRKLYEYLSLARPILAIAEPRSATARMINELCLGYVAEDNVNAIKRAIVALYEGWKSGQTLSIDEDRLRAYHNRYLSGQLRDIMLGLARTS
jgi:hypothetical protein